MRVFIDDRPTRDANKVRGVGYYTNVLIESLKAHAPMVELVDNEQNADIIHYPYFDLFFPTLPLSHAKPTVVTVHDVIPLVLPKLFPRGIKGTLKLWRQKFALGKVNAIATISETSRHDIERYLSISEKKIFVTYVATTANFKPREKETLQPIKEKYHLPDQFLLYVGDVNANKNLPRLVEALSLLTDPIPLVLVGKAFLDETLQEVKQINTAITEKQMNDHIMKLGFVPDDDLPAIINLATAYIQPSLYEGFGIPVLNALASATPTLCGDTPALREVGGDAVLYFNPTSVDTMALVIGNLIRDRTVLADLKQKGPIRAHHFSQTAFAQKVVAIYQSVR